MWDDSYESTAEELNEPVAPPLDVLTRTADENIECLLSCRPPADALWPDDKPPSLALSDVTPNENRAR